MREDITILVVEPGRKPRRVTIEHTLENLQKTVGGTIQAIYPWEDDLVGLICNDDAIALGLPFNRYVQEREYGPILGTFFICGLGEEDFISLTEEQLEKYAQRFALAELLFQVDGRLAVVPTPPID